MIHNKKGQTLILFIILIPLLIILLAFIIDSSYLINENIKLNSTTKTILKEALEKNYTETKIKDLYNQNKIPIENLLIIINQDEITIKNNYKIKSIFANIIGIKTYDLKIKMTATKNEQKITYKKE